MQAIDLKIIKTRVEKEAVEQVEGGEETQNMNKLEDQDSYQNKEENLTRTNKENIKKVTQENKENIETKNKKKIKVKQENIIQKSIKMAQRTKTLTKGTGNTNPGIPSTTQERGREALALDIEEENPRLYIMTKGEKTTAAKDMTIEKKEMIEKTEMGGGPMAKGMINEGTAQGP